MMKDSNQEHEATIGASNKSTHKILHSRYSSHFVTVFTIIVIGSMMMTAPLLPQLKRMWRSPSVNAIQSGDSFTIKTQQNDGGDRSAVVDDQQQRLAKARPITTVSRRTLLLTPKIRPPSRRPTRKPTRRPTKRPTVAPILPTLQHTPRFEAFRKFLLSRSVSSHANLYNPSSPQYRALSWIATKDPAHLNFSSSSALDVIETRYILAAFYYATNGDKWHDKHYFLSAKPVCLWHKTRGVYCTYPPQHIDLGQPISIEFYSNNLDGTIITEIGRLKHLKSLGLVNNSLRGALPTELGMLQQLTGFNLGFNSLKGTIVTELGRLSLLHDLNISSNQLEGTVVTEIGRLKFLQSLSLERNSFVGTLPSEIALLRSLIYLDMAFNLFSGTIPVSFGSLSRLQDLRLNDNSFSGTVPGVLAKLPLLTILDVHGNRLSGDLTKNFCSRPTQWEEFAADCRTSKLTCSCCTECF